MQKNIQAALERVIDLPAHQAKTELLRMLTAMKETCAFDLTYQDPGCGCCGPGLERDLAPEYGDYLDAEHYRAIVDNIAKED